ncbi:kinase-like domain-containing protein [Amylocarpus encephaloides]|uniref:Kinase-like domain-containing protein n=1 Tax=Amylocarpus encephaloides TaxID=45428 RepID=A0A9P7YPE8_9HELO|nr:kinase-like domain-containing protein [Amylocarpus encephaloides]
MATASPTPMGSSHFDSLLRRPSSRQIYRQQPSRIQTKTELVPAPKHVRKYSMDSSDDEIPVPMVLSALTNALLNDGEPAVETSPKLSRTNSSPANLDRSKRAEIASISQGGASPSEGKVRSPYPRRVVRLNGTPSTLRRSTSLSMAVKRHNEQQSQAAEPKAEVSLDLSTPAPIPRTVRIPITARGSQGSSLRGSSGKISSRTDSGGRSEREGSAPQEHPTTVARSQLAVSQGSVSRYAPSTIGRRKFGEEAGLQSSMRSRQVTGMLLRGPARRGRRRADEEEQSPVDEKENGLEAVRSSQEPESQESQEPQSQSQEPEFTQDPEQNWSSAYPAAYQKFSSGSPNGADDAHNSGPSYRDLAAASNSPVGGDDVLSKIRRSRSPPPPTLDAAERATAGEAQRVVKLSAVSGSPVDRRVVPGSILRSQSPPLPTFKNTERSTKETSGARPPLQVSRHPAQPVFKVPAPRLDLPATHDQENAPPTFKKNNQEPLIFLDNMDKKSTRPESMDMDKIVQRAVMSPARQPLALRSQNTPRRPAPPPPKMSILDAATKTAGAAASNASGRRNRVKVNGKVFTRLDLIGRGGSARVHRVMAENSTFYALKKVNLEDADEMAVQGFKGEINLLQKLGGDDRVIQLYDYEMNDEKGVLSVLMELGELDFKKVLDIRNKNEQPRFDPTFVRYYWKEMLECIQAIHLHDVVHSDLKPANFVLVKGRLKLIDFGIANAIETDQTINVHRENQIGTPNYMSPESLIDYNAKPDHRGRVPNNVAKLMKLGKPSDIWSLGCILYQLVYGRPPFDHIPGMLPRCQAIVNDNYAIEYPSVGTGSVPVPNGLIKTIKKCLDRDQFRRPTATDLLSDNDPFLNPIDFDDSALPITEELLGRILLNVASKIKDRTPTEAELLQLWPQGYFDRLRKNMADGKAL